MGRLGIALLVCAVLVGAGVFWVNRMIDHEIARIPRVALTTSTSSSEGTNILIVGSDSRDFVNNDTDQSAFGTPADTGLAKSDTMMVLHANGAQSYAVSFPRDTWVDMPGGGQARINAARNDGPQAVVDTLQQNFDVPIDHYIEVDFVTFQGLVDAVGGVTLYVPNPLRDTFTGLNIAGTFPFSCATLDGGQALAYVRSRHLEELREGRWRDISGLADLDRITRQQEFVKLLGRVAINRALDDPRIAPDMADKVIPNLTADAGFDRSAFDAIARSLLALRGNGDGLQFATLPTTEAKRDGGNSVQIVDETAAAPLLGRLRGDIAVEPPPDAASDDSTASAAPAGLRPSDVRVNVLNGSQVTGAAGRTLNEFVNRGFVDGTVGNDSRGTVARTEVRARAADAAKAQLVASYVAGAEIVVDNSLSGDVVVVVGKNFTKVAPVASTDSGSAAPETTVTTLAPGAACSA